MFAKSHGNKLVVIHGKSQMLKIVMRKKNGVVLTKAKKIVTLKNHAAVRKETIKLVKTADKSDD